MKIQEDFDFSSPLSVFEALHSLKKHTALMEDGSFYGIVEGNHFDLQHEVGKADDSSDNPQVSGYILKEESGCRVFARIQIPAVQESYLYGGTALVALLIVFITSVAWNVSANYFLVNPTALVRLLGILPPLISLFGLPYAGWCYLQRFNREGKLATINQFKEMLAA